MAGANHIKWRDRNWSEHGHYIYRSLTPMDVSNMPAHIAITEPNVTEYVDTDVVEGTEYFYRIGVYRNNDIAISPEMSMVSEAPNVGPGPVELSMGDPSGDGFYGEVLGTEAGLWTGDELATELGLTAGTSQYSSEPWLKFQLDGSEILYVSKKPFRHTISWDAIQAVNAVYGDRIIEKDGFRYEVTLLKCADAEPYIRNPLYGFDVTWTHGSEWNRLMYHIHDGNHTNTSNTMDSEGITVGDWASYTDTELTTHYTLGGGASSWGQETPSDDATTRVYRGYDGVSRAYTNNSSFSSVYTGWRPALRLIRN